MAKIFYLLKQNKNQGSKIFGKWFAHGKTINTPSGGGSSQSGGNQTPPQGGDDPGEGD